MRLQLFCALLLGVSAARADVLVMSDDSSAPLPVSIPTKGMTQAAVTQRYGAPLVRHATVGGASRRQPPITRWDYGNFAVVFEYNHVVDAVVKDHPAPVKVQSGLTKGSP